MNRLRHEFEPVWDEQSRVLILGSFPSVKSRENGFYYGHPRNRFWQLTARIFGENTPETAEEKRAMLLRNRVALWDVCASCSVSGSSDASITDVSPNDIPRVIRSAMIERVYCNGATAYKLLRRHFPTINAVCLPSTSPANAAWTIERLYAEWRCIAN